MSDYANIPKSNDYGTISSGSSDAMEVPKVWELKNRTGYKADAPIINSTRQTNLMIKGSSIPKSYATLTGATNTPMTRQFANYNTQAKVSYETSTSPDYQTYSSYSDPQTNGSAMSYYQNSPSANLAGVGKKIAMMRGTQQ